MVSVIVLLCWFTVGVAVLFLRPTNIEFIPVFTLVNHMALYSNPPIPAAHPLVTISLGPYSPAGVESVAPDVMVDLTKEVLKLVDASAGLLTVPVMVGTV